MSDLTAPHATCSHTMLGYCAWKHPSLGVAICEIVWRHASRATASMGPTCSSDDCPANAAGTQAALISPARKTTLNFACINILPRYVKAMKFGPGPPVPADLQQRP